MTHMAFMSPSSFGEAGSLGMCRLLGRQPQRLGTRGEAGRRNRPQAGSSRNAANARDGIRTKSRHRRRCAPSLAAQLQRVTPSREDKQLRLPALAMLLAERTAVVSVTIDQWLEQAVYCCCDPDDMVPVMQQGLPPLLQRHLNPMRVRAMQLDRLIEVQPSQAQALNSQLPPGFMYVPAACLPADYQAALQLTSPAAGSAADSKLPQGPSGLPPSSVPNLAPVAGTRTSAVAGGAGGLPQLSAGAAGAHKADGVHGASAEAAEPPDGTATTGAAASGELQSTLPAPMETDEDYEPLAALAGSRAPRGPRDKTPRRPRTSEMTRPGARPGKRGKRAP